MKKSVAIKGTFMCNTVPQKRRIKSVFSYDNFYSTLAICKILVFPCLAKGMPAVIINSFPERANPSSSANLMATGVTSVIFSNASVTREATKAVQSNSGIQDFKKSKKG